MGSIGKYSGEALATMEKIMGDITSYYPNKVYKMQSITCIGLSIQKAICTF